MQPGLGGSGAACWKHAPSPTPGKPNSRTAPPPVNMNVERGRTMPRASATRWTESVERFPNERPPARRGEPTIRRYLRSKRLRPRPTRGLPTLGAAQRCPTSRVFWPHQQCAKWPLPQKGLALTFGEDAGVAQLAEQLFCKQQVTGSIPVAGSGFRSRFCDLTPTVTPTPAKPRRAGW